MEADGEASEIDTRWRYSPASWQPANETGAVATQLLDAIVSSVDSAEDPKRRCALMMETAFAVVTECIGQAAMAGVIVHLPPSPYDLGLTGLGE